MMKYFVSLIILGSAFSANLFAQNIKSDNAEFKQLTKQLSSQILKGGKYRNESRNYVAESFISKVNFRGCEVEIKSQFNSFDNSVGTKSPRASNETIGEVAATRKTPNITKLIFNLKDLDPSLLEVKPSKQNGQIRLFFETQNSDETIEIRSKKASSFTNRYSLGIRESTSDETIEIFKSLINICQGN